MTLAAEAYRRWGEGCVDHLAGDFAFAVSDSERQRVFAARDPFGAKPLYYRISPHGIAIAGSAEAVAAQDGLPLRISERRIADVLVGGLECADATSTPYTDLFRLPPAHTLAFERGRLTITRWWTPETVEAPPDASDDVHEEEFRSTFRDAVRSRLTATTAVMLSGGLDSSAIAGFARRSGGTLTTLSAVSDDPDCEETGAIRAMGALAGLDAAWVRLPEVAQRKETLARLLLDLEDPFDATMVIPWLLYDEARRRGLDAVLDGVDGDAVASVEPHVVTHLIEKGDYARAWREALGLGAFYGTGAFRFAVASALRAWAPPLRRLHRRWCRPLRLADALEGALLSDELARAAEVGPRLESLWAIRADGGHDPRRRHAIEIAHPQIAAALERYHRVAAAHGVEARHPFLDRRVVTLCLALPWERKLRDGWSKWIVRQALRDLIPDEVRWRRGRFVRLGPAFLQAAIGALRPVLESELASGLPDLAPFLDRRRVRTTVDRFRRGDPAAGERVWQAVALNSWLRRARARRYDPRERANGPAAFDVISTSGEASLHF